MNQRLIEYFASVTALERAVEHQRRTISALVAQSEYNAESIKSALVHLSVALDRLIRKATDDHQ